jgi:uncharacterized protein (DUF362 family)/ferredoxin
MTDVKVSVVRTFEYERDRIYEAVESGIDLIGSLDDIIKPGSKVFVKINHLAPPSKPERGIVTHPVFAEAVIELLKRHGADIIVGDDIESGEPDGFAISGFRQMCERAQVKLINLREGGFTEVPCNGVMLDKVYASSIVREADVIVDLPKLKTHSLTVFTGGIKNMYGTIPGGLRSRYHGLYKGVVDFSQMLTDVFSTVTPHLTIMDGIMAMEGQGPAAGKLRNIGIILLSRDAVALDAVATAITGLDPSAVYTTKFATERGLGTGDIARIEICGEELEHIKVTDFKYPVILPSALLAKIPSFILRYFVNRMATKPYIKTKKCTGCRECEKICPTGAALVYNKKAAINRSLCIQCMCCHEVCRFDAIVAKRSALGNTIYFLMNLVRFILRLLRRQ